MKYYKQWEVRIGKMKKALAWAINWSKSLDNQTFSVATIVSFM